MGTENVLSTWSMRIHTEKSFILSFQSLQFRHWMRECSNWVALEGQHKFLLSDTLPL